MATSLAFAFLLAETGLAVWNPIPFGNGKQKTVWTGSVQSHPEIGYVAEPYSVRKTYYPDNPREYFTKETAVMEAAWDLRLDGDNRAILERPTQDVDHLRVAIQHASGSVAWDIQLNQPDLPVTEDKAYAVVFQAKADSLRKAIVAFSRAEAPWSGLGLYQTISLTPEWQDFSIAFTCEDDFDNGRIHFDLGGSAVSVDLREVRLIDTKSKQIVKPRRFKDSNFFVSYRTNALGCRGPDYAIPKPDSVFRILALGDSFTQGVGVHEEDTFCMRLSEYLNERERLGHGKRIFEVINGGLAGYDTRQERSFYEHFGRKYQPDIVLAVMVSNDYISYLDESNRDTFWRTPGRLGTLFHLIGLVDVLMNRPEVDFSENVTEIRKLERLVLEDTGRLGIVIFRNTPPKLGIFSFADPWHQLAETISAGLRDTEIPVLDLQDALYKDRDRNDLMVHAIDYHPNEIAHEIAARTIEDFLYETGFIEPN